MPKYTFQDTYYLDYDVEAETLEEAEHIASRDHYMGDVDGMDYAGTELIEVDGESV